ncbi:MAG: hydroxyacid dehydrogenase [Anaerolineales bacterium]|nr:hydroxyacid dehydrogenase [Chloroflexota bacterium]MBL6979774.1 hydroxyacid dehydrogenase [Anaerolineales bacterium]
MEQLRVHITQKPSGEYFALLEKWLEPGIELTFGLDVPIPGDYQILVDGIPSPELLAGSPDLSVLIIPWAGLSVATRQTLCEFPKLKVHNIHHNAAPTAEMALTLLLAVAKQLIPQDQALRANDWRPRYQRNQTMFLRDKNALILGYGAIGQELGQMLNAFGVKVLAIRRSQKVSDDRILVHPPEALPELLPKTEILMITLPLTDDTEGMISERELGLLPRGAILVNVGRGPVVDQDALYHALKAGKLLGTGLDVWYNYPADEDSRTNTPPADHPFHELDNVVMSPHRAGGVAESEHLRMAHLADLLNAVARGESIPNRVDLKRGY